MRIVCSVAVSAVLMYCLAAVPQAFAELIPGPDGQTVYDSSLHVTWLANANLAGSSGGQFGVPGINPSGSMSYSTAQAWVAKLNDQNYLGHNTWTLPASPAQDPTCSTRGTNQERFGIGCSHSALGNLYHDPGSLHLTYPDTVVALPSSTVGPFVNFQPYLYWLETGVGSKGWKSFSFNTGFQGANTINHVMYVLPMFDGPPPATDFGPCLQPSDCPLESTPDGTLVYDPVANVTWLADANFAQSANIPCGACTINADGAMTHASAEAFMDAMNKYNGSAGWLGVNSWKLPPTLAEDPTCSLGKNTTNTFGFGCTGGPLGELYYNQLLGGLPPGTPVVNASPGAVGPFNDLQPYLYWSCQQAPGDRMVCGGEPAQNFQWSFSFGNGFQGTDVVQNDLYVMVYYPDDHPLPVPTPRS